jgi:hypothetical protein
LRRDKIIFMGGIMLLRQAIIVCISVHAIFAAGTSSAADQINEKTQDQTRLKEQIYGSQLMTEQERLEHRKKMQSLKTAQERESFQMEHHKLMQERAKDKGISLPPEPMMRQGGMGPAGPGPGGAGAGAGRK